VPESLEDIHTVLQLAAHNRLIAPCAGLHPVQPLHSEGRPYSGARCVRAADLLPVLETIRDNADRLVAVGEVWGAVAVLFVGCEGGRSVV